MPKIRWIVLGLVVGMAGFAHPASADAPKPAGQKAEQPKSAAPPTKKKVGPPPSKQTAAKVGAYIELINAESEHVFSLRESWLKEINPKVGPTCKERNVSIETTIGPDGGRYEAYRKKLKAKPTLPPDAAALKMVDAVEELRNIGKRPGPHNEYQGRSKPEEWCQQLKEVFPLLLAALEKYGEGNREVRAYVDNFTDERDQRAVSSTLQKYGKHYRYQLAALTLEGTTMMRALHAELAKESPDAAAVREKFAPYFAIADETKKMMDQEPPHPKTEPYPNPFSFFLIESMPKLKRASDALLTTLAQKPDKKQKERLDHDFQGVVSAYNEIIGYMNQIHFDQKQK